MSDKKDKGYDASMLRFVGNLIAGTDWTGIHLKGITKKQHVTDAVEFAVEARRQLRKLQKEEEES